VRRSILRSPTALRIKFAVNVLLALTFVVLLLSGLMISQSVLGNGMAAPRHSVWNGLHSVFGNVALRNLLETTRLPIRIRRDSRGIHTGHRSSAAREIHPAGPRAKRGRTSGDAARAYADHA
jgi:hypothetical protein